MTWFMVLWISLECPGGWFGGFVPGFLKPVVCSPQQLWAIETQPARALSKAREAGCGAKIWRCKGLKCNKLEAECRLEVKGL